MNQSINNKELNPFFSPFIKRKINSQWIMSQVMVALTFPSVASIYYFGIRSLWMILFSILVSVGLEYLYQTIAKKEVTIKDRTAIITGWLIALTVPVTAPFWTIFVGDFVAIVIIKQLFGHGVGNNIINPAVFGRVFLKIFCTPWITNWVTPGPDVVATSTPLANIGFFEKHLPPDMLSLTDLFLGKHLGGPIGETSKLMILIAFIYLVSLKVIDWRIPVVNILSCGLVIFLYSHDLQFTLTHILSGTLVFGAVFMITDYTTTPITRNGKLLFAACCGVLIAFLRICFNLPGGVGIAIVVMNLLTPSINKVIINNKIKDLELYS